jgi:hypothetical protein
MRRSCLLRQSAPIAAWGCSRLLLPCICAALQPRIAALSRGPVHTRAVIASCVLRAQKACQTASGFTRALMQADVHQHTSMFHCFIAGGGHAHDGGRAVAGRQPR